MFVRLRDRIPTLTKWLGLAVILIVAGYFIDANRDSVWQQLRPLVTRQGEKITELYFTDYDSLPKTPSVGRRYAVTFTIVNHEGENMVYQYQAIVTENGKSRRLDPQSVAVADGQAAQLQASFSVSQPYVNDEIAIDLLNTNQSIRYKVFSLK